MRSSVVQTECGGWFAAYVPGQPREAQGEKAFCKGSVDDPEWGSYHQTSMMYDQRRISDPGYRAWPRK